MYILYDLLSAMKKLNLKKKQDFLILNIYIK